MNKSNEFYEIFDNDSEATAISNVNACITCGGGKTKRIEKKNSLYVCQINLF